MVRRTTTCCGTGWWKTHTATNWSLCVPRRQEGTRGSVNTALLVFILSTRLRWGVHINSAVSVGSDSISGPELPGVAWDVEEQRLCHQGSLTSQLSNNTIQSYGDESQIRLWYLMQERQNAQGQNFIWILHSRPCKGNSVISNFPNNFFFFFFFRNLTRLPRTLNPTLFSYFIWPK